MTALALFSESGCFIEFPAGLVGQVVTQGPSGPRWSGPSGITIADVGNYFTTDNVEAALQQLGAALSGVITPTPTLSCEDVQDCVGAALVFSSSGLAYIDAGPYIFFDGRNLASAIGGLSENTMFVMANAPTYPNGTIATAQQVAEYINPFLTTISNSALRPWAVVGDPVTQPSSSDSVSTAANIVHAGKMVRGAASPLSVGAEFENKGNIANGSGNHSITGSSDLVTGSANTAGGNFLFIAGRNNQVINSSSACSVLAGDSNIVTNSQNSVAGTGLGNILTTVFQSGVFAGLNNRMTSTNEAGIFSGRNNSMTTVNFAGIGAGDTNTINSADTSWIGAGISNQITLGGSCCSIGAGQGNWIQTTHGSIGAGQNNKIATAATHASIGGGFGNEISISAPYSAIGGGYTNFILAQYSGILSGLNCDISPSGSAPPGTVVRGSFIGAGDSLFIQSSYSAIVSGQTNHIGSDSSYGFIGGGRLNAIDLATDCAILGGRSCNIQSAVASMAMGANAQVLHSGVFIWHAYDMVNRFSSVRDNEFAASGAGGFRFRTNAANNIGADLAPGANAWVAVSATALKGQFKAVDPLSILRDLLAVPIQTYQFKDGDADYHSQINLGPTAEDWNKSFGPLLGEKYVLDRVDGEEVKTPGISDGDKMGVALASIQGLALLVEDLKKEIATLKRKFARSN